MEAELYVDQLSSGRWNEPDPRKPTIAEGMIALVNGESIRVGIGFATGRKSFQKVLRTYVHNWMESGLVEDQRVSLNLLVAYDLSYRQTQVIDYTNMSRDLVRQIDSVRFIGSMAIEEEIAGLVAQGVISVSEARQVFGKGYAGKRNALLYSAIADNMAFLIFLDDDEYPVAVTNTRKTAIWGGQHVLSTHLKYISEADITHGHHCGYISPIPYIEYSDAMTEPDFRSFIEAISNDILNWDRIRAVMSNGGVTYADTRILTSDTATEVQEVNGAKFISGANLCINLTDPLRVFPFYNPPGARGEDTFLSTCLSERRVLRVPCYTFHDGFSTYNHLLEGVLPIRLRFIDASVDGVINRFHKACIGWIRYKPLLLYVTQPDHYARTIEDMRRRLDETLPKICAYFKQPAFASISSELEKYHRNVEKHYCEFRETQRIWSRLMEYLASRQRASGQRRLAPTATA